MEAVGYSKSRQTVQETVKIQICHLLRCCGNGSCLLVLYIFKFKCALFCFFCLLVCLFFYYYYLFILEALMVNWWFIINLANNHLKSIFVLYSSCQGLFSVCFLPFQRRHFMLVLDQCCSAPVLTVQQEQTLHTLQYYDLRFSESDLH